MTRDYKNITDTSKPTTNHPRKSIPQKSSAGLPGWLWLVAGLVIGSFVSFLVYLKTNVVVTESANLDLPENVTQLKKIEPPKPDNNVEKIEEERFKFYDILPQREVSVPIDEVIEPGAKENKSKQIEKEPATTTGDAYYYFLQAGSFFNFKDADKHKANLAFMGVQSKILALKTTDDKTIYRVRIGPYDNMAKINEIQNMLKQNNIKSLLIKIRG